MARCGYMVTSSHYIPTPAGTPSVCICILYPLTKYCVFVCSFFQLGFMLDVGFYFIYIRPTIQNPKYNFINYIIRNIFYNIL